MEDRPASAGKAEGPGGVACLRSCSATGSRLAAPARLSHASLGAGRFRNTARPGSRRSIACSACAAMAGGAVAEFHYCVGPIGGDDVLLVEHIVIQHDALRLLLAQSSLDIVDNKDRAADFDWRVGQRRGRTA